MKERLSIYLTAVIVAVLLVLTFTVSPWFCVPYVLFGMAMADLAKMRFDLGSIGTLAFGFIWALHIALACCLTWMKPYRDKTMVRMIPVMNDLVSHHTDGNYQYKHN